MSLRLRNTMSLGGINASDDEKLDLNKLFSKHLNEGLHGICFSAYTEDQKPGDKLSEEQIRSRMKIIAPHTKWVRTFSCTDGNELIPVIAKEFGIKTMVGAWLGDDLEKNEEEIEGLLTLAKGGNVDLAAVGNEVLYRKELTESELIDYINKVKNELNGIPVGYVDAYYEFADRPAVTEICDVIFANCYPFWEGCHIDYSFLYMKEMYNRAKAAGKGKRVIITETGWPNRGSACHGAEPSHQNALKYFVNTQKWSQENDIETFYFASFDEEWKVKSEGDVGAYWGLWDYKGDLKYGKQ